MRDDDLTPSTPGGSPGGRPPAVVHRLAWRPEPRPDPRHAPRPWLDAYPPGVPTSYGYPEVPLTRFLDDAAQDFPDVVATNLLGARTTYRELLDTADRLAAALAALGVRKGDRVGVLLPTCPQHLATLYATWRLGAVVTEHDPSSTDATLERELKEAGCRVVVCLDAYYPALARLKGRLPDVAHVVSTSLAEELPRVRRPRARRRAALYRRAIPRGEGVLSYSKVVARSAPGINQVPVLGGDPAAVLFTGTRSGAGVTLTHGNLVANAFQVRLWLPDVQAGREVILGALPLWRAYGLTTCALQGVLSAATLLLLPWRRPRDIRWAMTRKPTMVFGDPQVYELLAASGKGARRGAATGGPGGAVVAEPARDEPVASDADTQELEPVRPAAVAEAKRSWFARGKAWGKSRSWRRRHRDELASLRVCLSGDGELSAPLAEAIERRTGGKLREGWGLTECGPVTHVNPVYGRAKPGTAGLPLPDTVCWLADPADPGRGVPPGETGELLIAGPQVMRGYWDRPGETEAIRLDGWLRTRTLARIDSEGYCSIIGRLPTLS